ncbi:MAG: hypothetical protein Q9P01_05925 [Anaerolineae bacterium]|nr:hypothetical protein [Anaerolineae bacterium]MDQ7034374.1 hypothetical protein [Anaerolineae bacterium]
MTNRYSRIAVLAIYILLGVVFLSWQPPSRIQAQVRISDTPVRVVIPDATESAAPVNVLTATPTFTATSPPPSVFLEAAAALGDIIVLDFPETGTYLGSLEIGQQYPITGQYFSWIQFEYPPSPNGLAWVYNQTVRVVGDVSEIRIISNPNAANASPEENQTATSQAELLTPSIAETASAEARILIVPTLNATTSGSQGNFPPTFTPPPDVVLRMPTQIPNDVATPSPTPSLVDSAVSLVSNRRIAPIVPIVLLAGFGLLGLMISLIRRK